MHLTKKTPTIPPHWEYMIKKYVKKTFFAGTRKENFADKPEFTEGDYRFFAKGIRELSTAFTQERSHLPQNYLNQKEYRSGYILYFLPVNALKVTELLEKTQALPQNKNASLHFLDLGCGPGTALLGTFEAVENSLFFKDSEVFEMHWTLIDQNKLALHDAQSFHDHLLNELRKKYPDKKISSTVRVIVGNLFNQKISQLLSAQKFDIIFALNFLNEFPREKRIHLVDGLLKHLQEDGKILLMEPALRLTSRELMKLHDELIDHEVISVLSPCLHQSTCPMLAENNRDWCHTYLNWNRPEFIVKLDHLAGIKKDYLKCSYLLLGKKPKNYSNQEWRVVSGALNSKGKSERLLCGPGNLPHLLRTVRLDKDEAFNNHLFDQLERGDVVKMPKLTRIQKETVIQKIE